MLEIDIFLLGSDDLKHLYQKTDSYVKKRLLGGDPWDGLKEHIEFMADISKELSRRQIVFNIARR